MLLIINGMETKFMIQSVVKCTGILYPYKSMQGQRIVFIQSWIYSGIFKEVYF